MEQELLELNCSRRDSKKTGEKKRKVEEDKGKISLSKAGAAMHWKGELGVIMKSPMVNQE